MDRETVEEIKRHFGKTADDIHGHFDETVEDMKRQFGILAEGLSSDMRVVAEGQDIVRERLGGLEVEVRGLKEVVQRVHSELTGRLNDHEGRLTVLERKPAKGR